MNNREELLAELKEAISTLNDDEITQVSDFVSALTTQCNQEPV